jgi:hypothetical protein
MLKTDLHIIKKFIFGDSLSADEASRFEAQKDHDAEFKENLTEYQNIPLMIRRTARQEIREKLTHFEKTGTFIKEKEMAEPIWGFNILRGGKKQWAIGLAASLTLLISWSIWQFQTPALNFDAVAEKTDFRSFNYLNLATVRSKQKVEKTPFDADIAYLTTKYGAENAQKLATAMTDIKDKRFKEAADILSNLPFVDNNDSMRLSRADAYLSANDANKAIADYTVVAQNQAPQYKDIKMIADWHLALAYLKKGDIKESRRRIEVISQTEGHSFQQEAKETMKDEL